MITYLNKSKLSPEALLYFTKACKENKTDLHCILISKDGEPVLNMSVPPYESTDKRQVYSFSKSFTSTAIGLAEEDGLLDVNDRVVDIFSDKLPASVSDNLAAMSVRHLLTMSCGQAGCSMSKIRFSEDGVRTFLAQDVKYEPGSVFLYNTGASYMLSAIITKLTGITLFDYLTGKLFVPLGIENASWPTCAGNVSEGGFGLHISCEDAAKFGCMLLGHGRYNGRQVVPEDWIRRATSFQMKNSGRNTTSDWEAGYGYQFWCNARGGYRGDGAFGQFCYVDEAHDITIAAFAESANMQNWLDNITWLADNICNDPAHTFQSPRINENLSFLPTSSKMSIEDLNAGLAAYNNLQDNPADTKCGTDILYKFGENALGITFAGFGRTAGSELVFRYSDGTKIQQVICGNGKWIKNEFFTKTLKPKLIDKMAYGMPEKMQVAAAYNESDDGNTIKMIWRNLDNPHKQEFICTFTENRLSIRMVCAGRLTAGNESIITGIKVYYL